jgi:hypothetical protein
MKGRKHLQTRTVNDLHVDSKLLAIVSDDQDSDATTAGVEGFGEAGPEVGLINDGDGLLDITGLGHGNNCEDMLV